MPLPVVLAKAASVSIANLCERFKQPELAEAASMSSQLRQEMLCKTPEPAEIATAVIVARAGVVAAKRHQCVDEPVVAVAS